MTLLITTVNTLRHYRKAAPADGDLAARRAAAARIAQRRARRAIFSALAAFAALQIGMSVIMDHWVPVLHDPEYGRKLALLRGRQAEAPNRPLTLVLGSSRSGLGLDPESFAETPTAAARDDLVFNFAITGCGPIQEFQLLKRLLRHGVNPRRVLIEVHPLLYHQENGIGEECWIEPRRMDWRDLILVVDYVYNRRPFVWRWCRCHLAPWYSNRFLILNHFLPTWLDQKAHMDPWSGLTDYGWLPLRKDAVTPEEFQKGTDNAKREYSPMFDAFRVTEPADRALRNLLALCRQQRIETALFVMPEGSQFRGCYTAAARQAINDYLAVVSRQCEVPVYDATEWCNDQDFWDSHHLLVAGAKRFSERFAQQVLADFMARGGSRTPSLR
ncbi:MAG TPA: DUF1574 family protein [Pirellulales bacterium]|nr:DUF1574 family protein [Pirellulales bacterium]